MCNIPLNKLERTEEDLVVLKPLKYIIDTPSKHHKTIVRVFNHWLRVSEDKVATIEDITQTLHSSGLLIDDIQDGSRIRYGAPAAHHVFSVGLTLNAASHGTLLANRLVHQLDHPNALNIYFDLIEELHRGQGIELFWRDNFQCPTEEEYIDMIKQKTAAMFLLPINLLQLFVDNKEDYSNLVLSIGIYYGIRDDYCNLFNREGLKILSDNTFQQNNMSDSDITDGKFTLPIIHALNKSPEIADEIMDILKQRTNDWKLINRCVSLLEKHGGARYTADMLRRLEHDIDNEISRLGGNPALTSLMKGLRNWRTSDEK